LLRAPEKDEVDVFELSSACLCQTYAGRHTTIGPTSSLPNHSRLVRDSDPCDPSKVSLIALVRSGRTDVADWEILRGARRPLKPNQTRGARIGHPKSAAQTRQSPFVGALPGKNRVRSILPSSGLLVLYETLSHRGLAVSAYGSGVTISSATGRSSRDAGRRRA